MFQKTPRIKLSLKDWRKLQMYVYDRDKYCQHCGSPYSLDAAHVIGKGVGGDDAPGNLVVLCRTCHSLYDQSRIQLRMSVIEMLKNEPRGI